MVILIAGGSLSTGSHDPYCGTLMPLGPSTPSALATGTQEGQPNYVEFNRRLSHLEPNEHAARTRGEPALCIVRSYA